jgi:mannosyltransferase
VHQAAVEKPHAEAMIQETVYEPAQGFERVGFARRLADRLRAGTLAFDILIVSGVALVLGLIRLGAPAVWVDESFTVDDLEHQYSFYLEGYYWLFYTVEKPWTLVAGTSEWALRLPSVIAAMLSCALLVVLGRRLFDRRIALIAGLLLATSPFMVRWSQQARAYTMMVALVLVATLLLLRAVERGTRGAWALYGVAFAVVMVWHPVAGLLLVVPHAVLAYQRRGRFIPHGLLAVAIVMVFGVPWSAQLAMRSRGDNSVISWLQYPTPEVAGRALLDVSGATGAGVVLGAIGLLVLWRTGKGLMSVWLGIWALSPFVVALLASLAKPIFLDRYLIVAAPAFALLGGVALTGVGRRLRVALAVLVVVATAVGLGEWYSTGEGGNWRGEDWRGAVEAVQARTDGEVVVVPWWAHPAAEYYGADVEDTSSADSVWVLVWSEDGHDLDPGVRRSLGFGQHELVEQKQFGWRVSLQEWRRPGTP